MEFRAGDDAVAPTSHFPTAEDGSDVENGHALPFSIRTRFSNNPHEHFPLRQDEDDGEEFQRPLADDTETFFQQFIPNECLHESLHDCCLRSILPAIAIFLMMSLFFFAGLSFGPAFKLGPHASVLIDESPNPLLSEFVKVERIYEETRKPMRPYGVDVDTPDLKILTNRSTPMLFGFDKTPPLSIETSWSENHKATLHGYARKVDWAYHLNTGSRIYVSYNVTSLIPPQVYLVIRAVGEFSYYSSNLLGIPINGTGEIRQYIPKSAKYSVSLYNTRLDYAEVELEIKIESLVYDHAKASYSCSIDQGHPCFMKIALSGANPALLAFPNPDNGDVDPTHILVSYEPRWIVWLTVIGVPLLVIAYLAAVEFLSSKRSRHTIECESIPLEKIEPQGAILIPQKDDDVASSHDNDDPECGPSAGSHDGNVTSDHESDSNDRRLCAICFNSPRDCLFLPCGHSVSCYVCGIKIAKATGICSICRRHMEVKRIYIV